MKEIYKYITVIRLLLLVGVVGVLVLAAQQPALTAPCPHLPCTQVPGSGQCQAAAVLPPRPTPSPTPVPTSKPAAEASPQQTANGGIIQLKVSFAPDWPWHTADWQTLWTVVQWQDHAGNWHDVEGWQGTLDKQVSAQGYKTWWVAAENLGQGPFRWAIYKSQGGEWLRTSERFNLPTASSDRMTIEVSLE